VSLPLAALEVIIDNSGVAGRIEEMLPAGVRRRQLPVRTLFPGMLLAMADDRPPQLTRVHQALISLPQADQVLKKLRNRLRSRALLGVAAGRWASADRRDLRRAGAGRHHRGGRRGPGAGEGEHGGQARGERAVT